MLDVSWLGALLLDQVGRVGGGAWFGIEIRHDMPLAHGDGRRIYYSRWVRRLRPFASGEHDGEGKKNAIGLYRKERETSTSVLGRCDPGELAGDEWMTKRCGDTRKGDWRWVPRGKIDSIRMMLNLHNAQEDDSEE